jgi:NHL repeat
MAAITTVALGGCALLAGAAAGSDDPIVTIAGIGIPGFAGDSGPAAQAQLNGPRDVATLAAGGYLVADAANNRIRRVSGDGTITTVAGTGVAGFAGDGADAAAARLNQPEGVVSMADGGFLIADTANNRIRKLQNGIISTVAGTGAAGLSGDGGAATAARLSQPAAVDPTADGGFLIADRNNNRIRKVRANGTITTVAGGGSGAIIDILGLLTIGETLGDGGPATQGVLDEPNDVSELPAGGFLIADTRNNLIRKVSAGGTITSVAGNGDRAGGSDPVGDGGSATSAIVDRPQGVSAEPDGTFMIADTGNDRVRLVNTVGKIATVAGTTLFDSPTSVTSATGGFFVTDEVSHLVRFVGTFVLDPVLDPLDPVLDPLDPVLDPITKPVLDIGGGGASVGREPVLGGGRDPGQAAQEQLPPPAPPVVGERFNAQASKGQVLVTTPGAKRPVRLRRNSAIPFGTIINARRGEARLTVARDAAGNPQVGRFSKGIFQVRQAKIRVPITDIVLRGPKPSACPPSARDGAPAASAAKRAKPRRLWARGHGRFRTRGRHGAATVRGTKWLTVDRCDGTLVSVRRGLVAVRDFAQRKTVLVRAGERHLARPAGAARRLR